MSEILKITQDNEQNEEIISQVVSFVQSGQLAVIPTDTSYAVIADAFHPGAVTLLRMAKKQAPDIPIPVGVSSFEMAQGVANLSNLAADLAKVFWPGPLTILTQAQPSLSWPIGDFRTALSIRVPNYEIAQKIISSTGPVAMTGAQASGMPAVQDVEHAIEFLGDKVAVYLDAGPMSHNVSSVLDATTSNLRLMREGEITIGSIRVFNPNVIDATHT